jgi:CelD/BcsL family acetyltransferase involved in cellulose biosynthesis
VTVRVEPVAARDLAALEPAWRALEQDARRGSFFQSWTWVGCLADERYPDAVLVRAEAAGRVVGLALFNRRGSRLCLAESGDAGHDAPFIEHNGPLLADGSGPAVAAAMFAAAWRVPGVRRLVLNGVAPAVAQAAGGVAWRRQDRMAPFVDLDAVRAAGGDPLAGLSANARYQIRRSLRAHGARGEVCLRRATTLAETGAWLGGLITLHQESWRRRGKPGAFAWPFMRRFHEALLARAWPRHEVDLLQLAVGDAPVGYLYNFRHGGRVYAYQSGLPPQPAAKHEKPGLTAHALAIARAAAEGAQVYDFLGGADRYKLSLATASQPLVWVEMVPRWSAEGIVARVTRMLRRLAAGDRDPGRLSLDRGGDSC